MQRLPSRAAARYTEIMAPAAKASAYSSMGQTVRTATAAPSGKLW